jgi:hypothetical protein
LPEQVSTIRQHYVNPGRARRIPIECADVAAVYYKAHTHPRTLSEGPVLAIEGNLPAEGTAYKKNIVIPDLYDADIAQ